ncbi:hypothetical protein [Neisseria sp. oral taxon 014]|jgi:hypothetical protein|uniref:hypothetical protein n=1 Tax=Neisseria sp. oral taxon 014 TaxID=641148 RepID=UPI000680F45A|nr:hypothetical protein [Neisseria sp. oral taxon 014]DAO56974.1 MAG TPA: hypothetical protein [Caudoviricetes sp.]
MKEYVFKISVIDGKMKVYLPSISLNNDSTLPDLMAALTFEFIQSMSNDAIKDQKKFMEGAIDTLRTAKMIEAISKSRERPT